MSQENDSGRDDIKYNARRSPIYCSTVVEKRTKARGLGHPWVMTNATQAPAATYNIEEWMQGLKEDAAKVEARNGDTGNCRLEQRNAHSQHAG